MFDEETEVLARDLGLDVAFPPAALRNRLDSKIATTELGNEAGVPSVPNVLGRAGTYSELLSLAVGAGSAPTWSSRPRTATPGRRRTSSPRRRTGVESPTISPPKISR